MVTRTVVVTALIAFLAGLFMSAAALAVVTDTAPDWDCE